MEKPARIATPIAATTLVAIALAIALAGGPFSPHGGRSAAQEPIVFAIDADPSGNTDTSLGAIDECATVAKGEFKVDVIVANVEGLIAWESLFNYDKNILRVTAIDVRQFLAANAGSSVVNVSATLPDSSGSFYMGAGDVGVKRDSGEGILARLTLEASQSGVSPLQLADRDVDGDGTADIGPTLSALTIADEAIHPGDGDGDDLFDNPTHARVAVDMPCPAPTPTPAPGGGGPGGGGPGGGDPDGDPGGGGPLTPDEIEDSIRQGLDALQEADTILDGVSGAASSDDSVFVPGADGGESGDSGAAVSNREGSAAAGGNGIDIGRANSDEDWPMWLITLIVGAPLAFGVGLIALWRWRGPGF